ncbi:hypothetical protein V3C99_017536 [Haemonchus contortus]
MEIVLPCCKFRFTPWNYLFAFCMIKQLNVALILFTALLLERVTCRTLTEEEWNVLQTTYLLPNSTIVLHTFVFLVVILLLLYPPDAFVGAGFTFDNLAFGYLGSPEVNILEFQCRRFVLTRAFTACLPYMLILSLYFTKDHAILFTPHPTRVIHYIALISPVIAFVAVTYVVYHTMTRFCHLLAIRKLKDYGYDTQQVFTSLSSEFVRIDAFRHAISNVSKIIITDSCLFYCSRFQFVVAKLADVQFHVVQAEDTINRLHQAMGMNQYLTVAVSLPADIQHLNFEFKIDNVSMRDLETKLGPGRIEFSQEVRLKMSLTEKFIQAFLDQAKKNPRFDNYVKEELDPCLGCSEKLSNVKLFRQCNAIDINLALGAETSNCAVCRCRPMWCVSCMARIFLAKQDQSRPASWLEGTCPCPTCRAVFCIMDVALLSYFDEENSDELKSEEE